MSNKPYLTREKIDTLLKQGIKKRDFEDQIGFFCTDQGYVYKSDKNLKALAKDIWYEADYVYIENKDAFNFVAMLAYLTDDEIDAYYFNSNSFKGVGWYEIGTNHQLNYMKDIITSWHETMSKYSTCPPTEYNIILLDHYKKKITNLEDMMKNLNRFI